MGLYNVVFGTFPEAPVVLYMLDKRPNDFGRFRDAWIEKTEEGEVRFAVYTRNGGGNRESFPEVFKEMAENPLFLSERDDNFDATYATFYFKPPENALEKLRELGKREGFEVPDDWTLESAARPLIDTSKRWHECVEAMKAGTPNAD